MFWLSASDFKSLIICQLNLTLFQIYLLTESLSEKKNIIVAKGLESMWDCQDSFPEFAEFYLVQTA